MRSPRGDQRRDAKETPAPDVPSPGPSGGNEYAAFIWQQLNEMSATLGKLEQAIAEQSTSVRKLDEKADEVKERIHSINTKMAVAAAVVAVVFSVTAFVLNQVWDVLKPVVVHRLTADQPPATPPIQSESGSKAQSKRER